MASSSTEAKQGQSTQHLSDALITQAATQQSESPSPSPSPNARATSFPKSKIRILLLENIHQRAVDLFVKQGFQVETCTRMNEAELISKLQSGIHIIGVRSKTKLNTKVLSALRKKKKKIGLLAIGCFCIGTDQTELQLAAGMGIPVFNSPFANTRSVAELVIAHCVVLARKAGDCNRKMHQGVWHKSAKGCHEIRHKRLGIVGYGHVGSQLSVLAEAMGMTVSFYDIIPKLPLGNAKAMENLDELLRNSDFVSLHVPYTSETHEMIGETQLKLMPKGSYLLNAARGKCVQIDAVKRYLQNGHLGGAYFDVYPSEPTDASLCLLEDGCDNVVLTPHIGGSTMEAQENIAIDVASKLIAYVNEGCTLGAVNFPNVSLPSSGEQCHRILHVHQNVAGVLQKAMGVLSKYNVSAQILQTKGEIGYMIVETDDNKALSANVKKQMDALDETVHTRILYM